jgi:hypothetical protein
VVQADAVLRHALTHYDQKLFTFEMLSSVEQLSARRDHEHHRLAAVLLENHYDNKLAQDIDSARRIACAKRCPVFVLGDAAMMEGWDAAHDIDPGITFINKPVYIPVVLGRLAASIARTREPGAPDEDAGAVSTAIKCPRPALRNPS